MSDLPLLTDLRKLQEDVHEALPYHNDKVADDLMQAFDDICKRVADLQDEIRTLRARLEVSEKQPTVAWRFHMAGKGSGWNVSVLHPSTFNSFDPVCIEELIERPEPK